MQHLICERPFRSKCHIWNRTRDWCINDPDFGCHTYADYFVDQSDDPTQPKCELEIKMQAIRCPVENCTCQIEEWSQWSECEPKICSLKPSMQRRNRTAIEPCPENFLHDHLVETKPCKIIEGCDALRNLSNARNLSI